MVTFGNRGMALNMTEADRSRMLAVSLSLLLLDIKALSHTHSIKSLSPSSEQFLFRLIEVTFPNNTNVVKLSEPYLTKLNNFLLLSSVIFGL